MGHWWKGTSRLVDWSLSIAGGDDLETYDLDLIPLRASLPDVDKRAPYESLSAVVRELPHRFSGGVPEDSLTKRPRGRLLEWTTNFGLLGLLPHACTNAVLAPRWAEGIPFGNAVIQQETLTRSGAGWRRRVTQIPPVTPDHEMTVVVGDVVPPEFWVPGIEKPHALMRTSLFGNGLERVGLAEAWGPFFPRAAESGSAENYDYPTPLSEQFWAEYAEPLSEFTSAANSLTETIKVAWDMSDPDVSDAGIARLNMALDLTQPCFHREEELAPSMSHGSLISALAYMALRDMSEKGRMVKYCKLCGGLFTTRRPEAKYCSDRCRNRRKGRKRIGKTD